MTSSIDGSGVLALGSGLTYSVNTERFLYREPRFALGLRAGGSYMPAKFSRWPGSVVVGITALWGSAPEYLELGANNVVLIDKHSSRPLSLANFTIGYRHQPKVKGLLLRFAFTPFFTRIVDLEKRSFPLLPYAGFSVGYGF